MSLVAIAFVVGLVSPIVLFIFLKWARRDFIKRSVVEASKDEREEFR